MRIAQVAPLLLASMLKFISGYFIKVPDYERQTSQRVRLSARN